MDDDSASSLWQVPETLEQRKRAIECYRKLEYPSFRGWLTVFVERNGTTHTISWKFNPAIVGNPSEVPVSVRLDLMPLMLSTDSAILKLPIHEGYGNGSVTIEVPVCFCYYASVSSYKSNASLDFISFLLASPPTQREMGALLKLEQSTGTFIDEIDEFLEERDALQVKLENGILKIRAKGLPADEEEEQIQDLKDFVADLRIRKGK